MRISTDKSIMVYVWFSFSFDFTWLHFPVGVSAVTWRYRKDTKTRFKDKSLFLNGRFMGRCQTNLSIMLKFSMTQITDVESYHFWCSAGVQSLME